jgi:apolipoprotein D and lipocalin family protein
MVDHIKQLFGWTHHQSNEELEALRSPTPIDLSKFVGKWYDIESAPAIYDKDCTDKQAIYTLDASKGLLKIQNSCVASDHKLWKANGTAKEKPPGSGQLVVNFNTFYGHLQTMNSSVNLCVLQALSTPKTEYYQYAMLGSPDLKSLWFMSRGQQPLPPPIRTMFVERATALGFDVAKLEQITHARPRAG